VGAKPAASYILSMSTEPIDGGEDVPSRIDLREVGDAEAWVREADRKRPWRDQLRSAIAEIVRTADPPVRRVLELGAGPGLLAERVLRDGSVESYTLFDFSPAMIAMSRERIGGHPAARFVLGDFRQPDWTASVGEPFDAIVAMQAVHEIRHKRHVPGLYRQVLGALRPAGVLVVCDHVPPDDSVRMTSLHSTEAEQHAALSSAGLVGVATRLLLRGLYVCVGHRER